MGCYEGKVATLDVKYGRLQKILQDYGRVMVAFSGGIDSTLVLKAAVDALHKNVLAVTITGAIFPSHESKEAVELANLIGVEHVLLEYNEIGQPPFANNPPDRCYHCKKNMYSKLLAVAAAQGINVVVDGSNADDLQDYRPGLRAAIELGVYSPLKEVGLCKEEIRALSRKIGLSTADKPANPCLATRFPYGTPIDLKSLQQVEQAESYLLQLGIPQVRVRHHGNLARIEVPEKYLSFVLGHASAIESKLKGLGYTYVALDLRGYRTGSMNEAISI